MKCAPPLPDFLEGACAHGLTVKCYAVQWLCLNRLKTKIITLTTFVFISQNIWLICFVPLTCCARGQLPFLLSYATVSHQQAPSKSTKYVSCPFQCIKPCSQQTNWTELNCTKLTQLHDALLVTRVSVTKLIGYRAAVRALLHCCSSSSSSSSSSFICTVCRNEQ